MSTPDRPTILVPVGHFMGAFEDESGHPSYEVRLGPEVQRLSDRQFGVWGLAHGLPERTGDRLWDSTQTVSAARERGLTDAAEVLTGLLRDGLVTEVTLGSDSAVSFARAHRMVPLLLGLGNTAEEPATYSVGLPGQPVVTMSSMAYDLWEWAHLDPDLWTACENAAATASGAGLTDPVATQPLLMLDAFLSSVHVFLGPTALYFDRRLGG